MRKFIGDFEQHKIIQLNKKKKNYIIIFIKFKQIIILYTKTLLLLYTVNVLNPTNALRTNKLNNDFDASSFLEGKNKALEPLDYLHDTFDNEELTNSMSFISNSSLL